MNSSEEPDTVIPPGQLWVARNFERIKIVFGLLTLLVFALTLPEGSYIGSIGLGFLGAYLLGGWSAMRRLVRSPKWQFRQWYYILIDARQYHLMEYPDGSMEETEMKPKTGGWTSTRWYDE